MYSIYSSFCHVIAPNLTIIPSDAESLSVSSILKEKLLPYSLQSEEIIVKTKSGSYCGVPLSIKDNEIVLGINNSTLHIMNYISYEKVNRKLIISEKNYIVSYFTRQITWEPTGIAYFSDDSSDLSTMSLTIEAKVNNRSNRNINGKVKVMLSNPNPLSISQSFNSRGLNRKESYSPLLQASSSNGPSSNESSFQIKTGIDNLSFSLSLYDGNNTIIPFSSLFSVPIYSTTEKVTKVYTIYLDQKQGDRDRATYGYRVQPSSVIPFCKLESYYDNMTYIGSSTIPTIIPGDSKVIELGESSDLSSQSFISIQKSQQIITAKLLCSRKVVNVILKHYIGYLKIASIEAFYVYKGEKREIKDGIQRKDDYLEFFLTLKDENKNDFSVIEFSSIIAISE